MREPWDNRLAGKNCAAGEKTKRKYAIVRDRPLHGQGDWKRGSKNQRSWAKGQMWEAGDQKALNFAHESQE